MGGLVKFLQADPGSGDVMALIFEELDKRPIVQRSGAGGILAWSNGIDIALVRFHHDGFLQCEE